MHVQIQSQEFTEVLFNVQGVASGKTTIPIYSHVLLKTEGDYLRVYATDNDLGIDCLIPIQVRKPGSIALPAKNLFEIIKSLSSQSIELIEIENHYVEIKSGKTRFKLVGLSPEDFPALSYPKTDNAVDFSVLDIKDLIDRTVYSTSQDETRYNLSGTLWQVIEETFLRAVATDGHRLSYYQVKLKDQISFPSIIIPKRTLLEIKRIISSLKEESKEHLIQCQFSAQQIVFRFKNIVLSSRLVDGSFPDYNLVIPKQNDKTIRVSRTELMDALKRVSLLTTDKSQVVRFDISSSVMQVKSQNPALGEAQQEVSVDYEGPDIKIGFNAHYLLDALSCIQEGGVQLEMNHPLSPCQIQPIENKNFLAIVMPIRLE